MSDNIVNNENKVIKILDNLKKSSANITSILRIILVFISIYLVVAFKNDSSSLFYTKQMADTAGIAY